MPSCFAVERTLFCNAVMTACDESTGSLAALSTVAVECVWLLLLVILNLDCKRLPW